MQQGSRTKAVGRAGEQHGHHLIGASRHTHTFQIVRAIRQSRQANVTAFHRDTNVLGPPQRVLYSNQQIRRLHVRPCLPGPTPPQPPGAIPLPMHCFRRRASNGKIGRQNKRLVYLEVHAFVFCLSYFQVFFPGFLLSGCVCFR